MKKNLINFTKSLIVRQYNSPHASLVVVSRRLFL